jgi:Fungal protein kinase
MSLFLDGNILHRDISTGNVFINRTDPERMVGFVGDLDNAIIVQNMETLSLEKSSEAKHRTGTKPFLAIGVLLKESHTYRHDLESFFYVFLWICIIYRGPNKERRKIPKEIKEWILGDFKSIAKIKKGQMDANGFKDIVKLFSNYFSRHKVLKSVAWKLRDLLFGPRDRALFYGTLSGEKKKVWYEKFMKILNKASKKF